MKRSKRIKKLSIIFISVIIIITVAILIGWQYLEYKKESYFWKKQKQIYDILYLKDRYKLEGKTVEEIQNLINKTDNEIEKISRILPPSNYINLYNFINDIRLLFDSYGLGLAVNNIESYKKDFYEEIHYYVTVNGPSQKIVECIEQMLAKVELISLNEVCLVKRDSDVSVVNIGFKAFMLLGNGGGAIKKVDDKKLLEEREIKTWLPPLSIWVKDHKQEALELIQLVMTKKDMKQKIDLFHTYRQKLKIKQVQITIIGRLRDINRKPAVSANTISLCTDL